MTSQNKEGKKIELNQVLNILDIDGMQFADERTLQLINKYHAYKNQIELAFDYITEPWEWVLSIFNRIYKGL